MPFLTEELWEQTGPGSKQEDAGLLIAADWPAIDGGLIDGAADAELGWLVEIISRIRAVRGEMNVPPGAKIPLILKGASAETRGRIAAHRALIDRLARLSDIRFGDAVPPARSRMFGEATIVSCRCDVIDLDRKQGAGCAKRSPAHGEIAKDARASIAGFIAKGRLGGRRGKRERREEAEQAGEARRSAERLTGLHCRGG